MLSFLSGGFSVLGGAFGSFAASDFFSGAVWLPSFVFLRALCSSFIEKWVQKMRPKLGRKTTRRFTGHGLRRRQRDSKNLS